MKIRKKRKRNIDSTACEKNTSNAKIMTDQAGEKKSKNPQ